VTTARVELRVVRICVFCGSSPGRSERYISAARSLGRLLAERGIGLVYGGASVGTMGALADAALDAGGEVIGVIPEQLVDRELAHPRLSDLRVVADMHERKARMAERADGFVALPGGAGTLEEFFEVWTWAQLGLHTKPLGLLDIDGYYQPLLTFIDRMVTEQFLRADYRDMLVVASEPTVLLDHFTAYQPPRSKWRDVPATVDSAATGLVARPPPPVDALAWVHVRDRRMLAVRARGNDRFYLPGGKRQPGESDAAALSREIREELGVELMRKTLRLSTVIIDAAHGYADGRQVRMACYTAEHVGTPAASGEIAELAWLSYRDGARCAPAARRVLDELHDRDLIS
jgi:uncharacterized protein (TIGR00730 family)